jgi:hypothetical protein
MARLLGSGGRVFLGGKPPSPWFPVGNAWIVELSAGEVNEEVGKKSGPGVDV